MAIRLKNLFKKRQDEKAGVCSVVVAAAGSSTRMEGLNKLLLDIGGKPVLVHTLTMLNKCPQIGEIIVVTRESDMVTIAELCTAHRISKVSKIIVGGQTRLESVYKGVQQVSPVSKLIAVHDGARPFVTEKIITATIEAAIASSPAAPAVPVTSTLKHVKNGMIDKTIDRENLYEVQTPQIFDAGLIKGALQNAVEKSLYITDDCMAVEALGFPIKLIEGSRENIKLTTAADIIYAEAIFKSRRESK